MASIVDVANQLIPPGVVSSSTDFAPIEAHPRQLPRVAGSSRSPCPRPPPPPFAYKSPPRRGQL